MWKASPRRTSIVIALTLAVLLTVGFLLWPRDDETTALPVEPPSTSQTPSITPTPSPSPSRTLASATPTPSPSPSVKPSPRPKPSPTKTGDDTGGRNNRAAQGCTSPKEPFTPTHYTIQRIGAHERVISMRTKNGQIPAPPKNDRRSAGLWNGGPQPGSAQGKVVLTIHTYRPGLRPAVGNELFAGGKSKLQPGDILKLHGKNGQVQCYEFVEAPKIRLSEYDPDSTIMIDEHGPSAAVIIICWDFNKRNKDWDSRVLFQFRAVS